MKLQQLDVMKDNFLSSVSHELRTPLTAIKGSAEILLEGQGVDDKVRTEFLNIIVLETGDELEELADAINNMAFQLRDSYANLEQKIEDRTQNLINRQQLLIHVEAAKENERKFLATELHDQTLSELAGIAVELGFLADQASGYSEELKQAVNQVREHLKESDRGLREIVQGIFPPVLTIMGLIPAVNSFLSDISSRPIPGPHPLQIRLVATGFGNNRLEENLEISLYRVIQQGLANVIHHADAKHVTIDLRWAGEEVTLALTDDGIGFDVWNPKESHLTGHYGLANLKSRIEEFMGRMAIKSQAGKGTTLSATIPVLGYESNSDESRVSTHILNNQAASQAVR